MLSPVMPAHKQGVIRGYHSHRGLPVAGGSKTTVNPQTNIEENENGKKENRSR